MSTPPLAESKEACSTVIVPGILWRGGCEGCFVAPDTVTTEEGLGIGTRANNCTVIRDILLNTCLIPVVQIMILCVRAQEMACLL